MELPKNFKWIPVILTITLLLGGGAYLVLQPDKFEIKLSDGTIKAKYQSGEFSLYKGRYLATRDTIQPYYYDGNGYVTMYKARGTKYSNISYFNQDGTTYAKQDIFYSQGKLSRLFAISEYEIKESFEWYPTSPELRVYFRWNYDGLDKNKAKVYYDSKNSKANTQLDFNITASWYNDLDNTVRVERFNNGRFTIRTRVYEGYAYYDPELLLVELNTPVYIKDTDYKFYTANDDIIYEEIKEKYISSYEVSYKEVQKNYTYCIPEHKDNKTKELVKEECNISFYYVTVKVIGNPIYSYKETKEIIYNEKSYKFDTKKCWVCGIYIACLDKNDGGNNIKDRALEYKCDKNNYPILRYGENGFIEKI